VKRPAFPSLVALAACGALVGLAACGGSGRPADRPSEWELNNARLLGETAPDAVPALPAYPKPEALQRFAVSGGTDFEYFVDRRSISVAGGEVRYTVVARSPSGVDNISFEGIHCKDREFRSYARGASDGQWIVRPTAWRKIEPRVHIAQYALHWEYLCPNSIAVYTAQEGVSALERGGHPNSKMPSSAGGGGGGGR